jgi:hypothetical protein
MRLRNWLAAFSLTLYIGVTQIQADPAKAEDEAYKMAGRYHQLGYAMAPQNIQGLGGSGYTVKCTIQVTKGIDYVFLVGGDLAALDIDLYVYDEVGNLILDDRRKDPRAGVKFRSSYSGTTEVYVHMARANGLAAYSVLVGRRGVDKSDPAPPSGPISEPSVK